MTARFIIAALMMFLSLPALAEVPEQAGWDDARRTASISGGQVAGYVEFEVEPATANGIPIVLIGG